MSTPAWVRDDRGGALVTVRVQPRASQPGVDGERGGALVVRVAAPPVEGRANEELRRTLAKAAGVAPSRVSVVRGDAARDKVVRIEGLSGAEAGARLGGGA